MDNQNQQTNTQGLRKFFNGRNLLIIFGGVILVEALWAINYLKQPASLDGQPSAGVSAPEVSSTAKIELLSSKLEYRVGETIPVEVFVSTAGAATDGTDVVIKFNSALLGVSANSLINGKIYSQYPTAQIDTKEGSLRISGIALGQESGFSGDGTFATVNFISKAAGTTNITLEYIPSSTADSNIVSKGVDILKEVKGLELVIK